ncbi:hypothetical protein [Pseudoalteromonas sp. NCIMB_1079]|uniref:hypothetical protein n=1 Tax=Pseudoalteromonas sp. NCIMB 1079 TaxID=3142847 RepID=UPI00339BB693
MSKIRSIITALLTFSIAASNVQAQTTENVVVEKGVLKWASGEQKGKELALFGVNYSAPFAYSYRALNKLGIDPKQAIDMDVDHIARLGLDAYRIHLWDRELTDKAGNLQNNHHLELFDYLLFKLSQKNIKVILTPLAWWGSGYPEPDPLETGFATNYSKAQMNEVEAAIAAQHIYLKQLMAHTNRYSGQRYGQDPNIVALELFNEPKHHQSPEKSISYIEGLIDVIRQQQVTKPLFYNISEQGNDQPYAKALCESKIDGIAYQWYPTGLVKNSEILANMLPMVASYTNVFASIASCNNKAKMIYEFDAADVGRSVMYPAMARSFRAAGFQWATQFSYDPGNIAHTNSEYNTHYLNLLYTPKKAISLMIAARAFKQAERGVESKPYPENNQFGDVELSYQDDLSLFNNDRYFYHSNTTTKAPKNLKKLKHIAGVGSSPVVQYEGNGAYFLDKLTDDIWQLEVYPDVHQLQDPYQNSSLQREVRRLYINQRKLTVTVDDLAESFYLQGINLHNSTQIKADNNSVVITPGKYLIANSQQQLEQFMVASAVGNQSSNSPSENITAKKVSTDYFLPNIQNQDLTLSHQPQRAITLDDDYQLVVKLGTNQAVDNVELLLRYRNDRSFTAFAMTKQSGTKYSAPLPKSWQKTGPMEYAFVVTSNGEKTTFPGAVSGTPFDWDFVKATDYWSFELQPKGTPLSLFDAQLDRNNLIYPKNGKVRQEYVSGQNGLGTVLKLGLDNLTQSNDLLKTTLAADSQLIDRNTRGLNTVAIKIRSLTKQEHINFALLDKDGLAFGTKLNVTNQWQYLLVPLSSLTSSETMMIQAYPSFMPNSIAPQGNDAKTFDSSINLIQGLQISLDVKAYNDKAMSSWHGIEIENVSLIKR